MQINARSIDFFNTHKCNLRCKYCYFEKEPEEMTQDTAERVVRWLVDGLPQGEKRANIYFFGGEPLCNYPLLKHTVLYANDYAKRRGKTMHYGITTNCTIWSDEIEQFIRKHKFGLNLSVDGDWPTQNAWRPRIDGSGSFLAVQDTVKRICSWNPGQGARLTVSRENVAQLAHNVATVWDMGCRHVFVGAAVNPHWTHQEIATYQQQLRQIASDSASRILNGQERHCGTIGRAITSIMQAPKKRRQNPCGAGRNYYAVDSNGNLYPCHRFVGNSNLLGNVLTGDYDEPLVRWWKTFDANRELAGCYGCPSRLSCAGNCFAANIADTGSLTIPSPVQCAINRAELNVARHLIKTMGKTSDLLIKMSRNRRKNTPCPQDCSARA